MKTCSVCKGTYSDEMRFCPADGAPLFRPSEVRKVHDPLIGAVLADRYRVIKRLGEGGMGSVYLAENIHAEMEVALKVLNSRASKDPVLLKRFEAERRIISRLRHPNILKLLDSFHTDDGELVVVIEYVNGETLEDRINNRGLSQAETLYILSEVFDALSEAHDAEIIHRDLKPSNLMLEEIGDRLVVKILDFGIAKTLSSTGMTNTGMTLGTPAYMSPEQVQGLEIDSRSDLYSMGCVAYECLAGQPPFMGENPFSIIRKHIKEPPASLLDRAPPLDVDADVSSFVFNLLAKKPDERPMTARAARDSIFALQCVPRALSASLPRAIASQNRLIGTADTFVSDAVMETVPPSAHPFEAPVNDLSLDQDVESEATADPRERGVPRIIWAAATFALAIAAWVWIFGSAPTQPKPDSKQTNATKTSTVRVKVGTPPSAESAAGALDQDVGQTAIEKGATGDAGQVTTRTKTKTQKEHAAGSANKSIKSSKIGRVLGGSAAQGAPKPGTDSAPGLEQPTQAKPKAKRKARRKSKREARRKAKREARRKAKIKRKIDVHQKRKNVDSKYFDIEDGL